MKGLKLRPHCKASIVDVVHDRKAVVFIFLRSKSILFQLFAEIWDDIGQILLAIVDRLLANLHASAALEPLGRVVGSRATAPYVEALYGSLRDASDEQVSSDDENDLARLVGFDDAEQREGRLVVD